MADQATDVRSNRVIPLEIAGIDSAGLAMSANGYQAQTAS